MAMHKDGGGDGESNSIKKMPVKGGTLVTSFAPDNSSGMKVANAMGGGKFGGGDSDLSHSLRGASAVQK